MRESGEARPLACWPLSVWGCLSLRTFSSVAEPGRWRVARPASPRDSPSCRSSCPRGSCRWTRTQSQMVLLPRLQGQSKTLSAVEWTVWEKHLQTKIGEHEQDCLLTCRVDTSGQKSKMRWSFCPLRLSRPTPPSHPYQATADQSRSPSWEVVTWVAPEMLTAC